MEAQNRMYPYQHLSPDVWSECLSYLPPNELSDAFELLPLSNLASSESIPNDSIKDVEYAAWLSVVYMVEIAHRFWENEASKCERLLDPLLFSTSQDNSDQPDTKVLELQRIIAKDTSIVADLFRNSKGTTKQTSHQLTRFQDETWQNLYGFLYNVLSESREYKPSTSSDDSDDDMDEEEDTVASQELTDEPEEQATSQLEGDCDAFHDHEAIALAVGLVFGIQPTRASMTPARRKKMESISYACSTIACGSSVLPQSYYKSSYSPTEARSYALSLRLAQEGFWDHASQILQSRIRSFQDKEHMTTDDESAISIDGMIYVSTFLIDRMYSQTYVRGGKDDKELATAVRLGRKAVTMAKTRYDVFLSNITTTEPTTDTGMTKISDRRRLPPPPIESLFANDVLRYIHAKLALGKALSLLAQHVALLATDPRTMEITPAGDPDDSLLEENLPPNFEPQAPPLMVSERERLWKNFFGRFMGLSRNIDGLKWIAWPILFFEESRVHLKEGLDACQEYSQNQKGKTRLPIPPLIGALESAEGERMYCASSASTRYGWEYSLVHYLKASICAFSSSFNTMMNELIQHALAAKTDPNEDDHLGETYIDATLDCLLRCGKDFGKTCGFGDSFGIDYRQQFEGRQEEQQKLIDKKMVFEFVYLVSIYRHGSFHPTTENVKRLGFRGVEVKSVDEMYTNVVAWLLSDYGSQ